MQHYRNVTIYVPKTRSTCISDTVTFLPHKIPFPTIGLQEYLKKAAEDIITILSKPPSMVLPTLEAGDNIRNALLKIAELLNRAKQLPLPPLLPIKTQVSVPPISLIPE